jgi:hypothetical protein
MVAPVPLGQQFPELRDRHRASDAIRLDVREGAIASVWRSPRRVRSRSTTDIYQRRWRVCSLPRSSLRSQAILSAVVSLIRFTGMIVRVLATPTMRVSTWVRKRWNSSRSATLPAPMSSPKPHLHPRLRPAAAIAASRRAGGVGREPANGRRRRKSALGRIPDSTSDSARGSKSADRRYRTFGKDVANSCGLNRISPQRSSEKASLDFAPSLERP